MNGAEIDQAIFDQFLDDTEKVAEVITSFEKVIQIVYQKNVDSMIAAAIFAIVFYDLQQPCTLTANSPEVSNVISKRSAGLNITIGIDMDTVSLLSLQGITISIIPPKEQAPIDLVLNANMYGISSKKQLNFAAIAYFICSPFAEKLEEIVKLPLVSFHAEFMMEEYQGFLKLIAEDAVTGKMVSLDKQLTFLGSSRYRISDALFYTLNPFLPGITGDGDKAIELLTKSGIEDEIKGEKRTLSDLSKEEITDLNSNLIVQLALHKGYQEEKLQFIRTKTTFLNEKKDSILANAWDYAATIRDSIHRGKIPSAMAVMVGNRTNHLRELSKIFDEERRGVGISYRFIQDNQEDVIDLSHMRYFEGDYKLSWYNTPDIAAMALSHGLITPDLPFAVVSPGPGNLMTIGIRASKSHNIADITKLVALVVEERGYHVQMSGSSLRCRISITKESYEELLFNINAKLLEIIQ